MELLLLICKQCTWKGRLDEVDWDTVETCMGTDKIEVCPKCGGMEVYRLPIDDKVTPI